MNTEFKNLRKAIKKQNEDRRKESVKDIYKITVDCPTYLPHYLKHLVPTSSMKKVFGSIDELKQYLLKRCEKHYAETLKQSVDSLAKIETAEIPSDPVITVQLEWKKSSTWGANPTAEMWATGAEYAKSSSVTGCGYDKGSTAVAQVLNQVPWLLKLLCQVKNKKENINSENRDAIAYGTGYAIIPKFEGGVGVSCYIDVCKKIGLKFETVASGKNFDAYKITKLK